MRLWGSVAMVVFCACAGEYDVRVQAAPELRSAARTIEVAIVPNCLAQSAAGPIAGDPYLRFAATETPAPLGRVDPGDHGLFARFLNDSCEVIAAGCSDISVEKRGSGTLEVTVVAAGGTACGTGEMCQAGACAAADGGPGFDSGTDAARDVLVVDAFVDALADTSGDVLVDAFADSVGDVLVEPAFDAGRDAFVEAGGDVAVGIDAGGPAPDGGIDAGGPARDGGADAVSGGCTGIDALVCNDFEAETIFPFLRSLDGPSTAAITSERVHHGRFAVKLTAPTGTDRAALRTSAFGTTRTGERWARAWFFIPGGALFIDLLSFESTADPAVSVTTEAASGSRISTYAFPADNQASSSVPLNSDRWTCVEMRINYAGPNTVELYIDGTSAAALTMAIDVALPIVHLGIPYRPRADPSDYVAFVDDVVLSTTRVGCGE